MIVNVSRRTDIPAYYTPWFINRVHEGFALTKNPFNPKQIRRVSLLPEDVSLFVFWTRNPQMLMVHLKELDKRGYQYFFQFTLNAYPKVLETRVPRPYKAVETFIRLSDQIGAEKVIWRYNPILLSSLVDLAEHKRVFAKIASLIAGKTHKVIISFTDFYKHTSKNLNQVAGLEYEDITQQPDALKDLSYFLEACAKANGMVLEVCGERMNDHLMGLKQAKCLDERFIKSVFNLHLNPQKDPGQPQTCQCIKSVDIGMYNTCLHGCAYCYATFDEKVVMKNKRRHDPKSPFLIGDAKGVDPNLLLAPIVQTTLF